MDTGNLYTYGRFEVRGWFTEGQREVYQREARRVHDGLVIEVGVYGGASLLSIASICKEQNTFIIGVDAWEWLKGGDGGPWQEPGLSRWRNVERDAHHKLSEVLVGLDLIDTVELRQAFSQQAARGVPDGCADLIMIDANHSYEGARDDLRSWRPKLKPQGVLLGHDASYGGVIAAVQESAKQHGQKVEVEHDMWKLVNP